MLTVKRGARRTAGEAGYGAAASTHDPSTPQDTAHSPSSASSSSTASSSSAAAAAPPSGSSGGRRSAVQLLLDLLQAGALLEAGHAVDNAQGHVCAGAGGAAVRVEGEDMGGPAQGADGHPAAVLAEAYVLDLEGGGGQM